eukprot:scaffold9409_cov116-Isochrysis_galbana.AAC.1
MRSNWPPRAAWYSSAAQPHRSCTARAAWPIRLAAILASSSGTLAGKSLSRTCAPAAAAERPPTPVPLPNSRTRLPANDGSASRADSASPASQMRAPESMVNASPSATWRSMLATRNLAVPPASTTGMGKTTTAPAVATSRSTAACPNCIVGIAASPRTFLRVAGSPQSVSPSREIH